MSNSNLICYTKLSPHCETRTDTIRKITIHHMAGNLSVETCGNVFNGTRKASSNYGIGTDGRIAMYVPEEKRAYTSANKPNDNQAITIEVANDGKADTDWHVSEKAIKSLINLCVDICKRNGIKELIYTGDKTGNLTRHNMFMATTCPGHYLQDKFPFIAEEVNKRLNPIEETQKPDENISKPDLLILDEIAREVIDGKWGNGQERFNRLDDAGYNSTEVQNRVNEILKKNNTSSPKVDILDLVKKTIRGDFGNGTARKNALGNNYSEVQRQVNLNYKNGTTNWNNIRLY